MKTEHYLLCEAPICTGDTNPGYKYQVVWYPGEKICKLAPYQKFQKKQVEINKLVAKGRFKNIYTPYTANELETKSI
jgi:hypothetical protein